MKIKQAQKPISIAKKAHARREREREKSFARLYCHSISDPISVHDPVGSLFSVLLFLSLYTHIYTHTHPGRDNRVARLRCEADRTTTPPRAGPDAAFPRRVVVILRDCYKNERSKLYIVRLKKMIE